MGFSLGELFISLGFDVDGQKLKKFKEDLRDTHEEMVKLGTVAGGTVASLALFVQHAADSAVKLSNMATLWGTNTQAAQTFANALHQVNSQISIVAGQEKYRAFAEMINAKVPQGSGAAAALARLGVTNPYGTADQVFAEIRQNLPGRMATFGTDPNKQRAVASELLAQIGLSDSLNAVLEPESQYQGAGKYNIQQGVIDNLSKYAKATAEFDEALNKFSTDMAGEIGPKMAKVVEWLTKTLSSIDAFNTAHPGASTAEGVAGATVGTIGVMSFIKNLFGGAGVGGAAGSSLRTMGTLGAAVGIAEGAWWLTGKEVEGAQALVDWYRGKHSAGSGESRGMRNNNPGNIKYGVFAQNHGAVGHDAQGFAIFPDYNSGSSAIGALLHSYSFNGINSISGIVKRYTKGDSPMIQHSYEKMLEKMTGSGPNDALNLQNPEIIRQLVSGIIQQENGGKGHITINVHSNAKDNQEVANLVNRHVETLLTGAYAQTNQGPQ